jgi:DNA helicase-2/ATP-dependent DNA helicase PcrA
MKERLAAFGLRYKALNKAQKEAVDAIEGPVMVVAGPGTGKTHILTLRIANILKKTDTPPDGILALTFTESGANTMRRRLAEIVGTSAYRVRIHTFHGYCQDVINRYPDEFPRIIGGEAVSDIERIDILSNIITSREWKHLKPFGNNLYYLNPIRGAISEMKRENVSPDVLVKFLAREQSAFDALPDLIHEKGPHKGEMRGVYQTLQKKLERTHELLEVYRMYEDEMQKRHRYDFEDMITEVVSAMERNKNLLLRLQEESLYILADEHQDANAAQNRLLELLGSFHDQPNLFVVGDEKQAIYRFQGASLENFLYFKKRFPAARLIVLTDSYRSGQEVLDVAHALASGTGETSVRPTPLTSKAGIKQSNVEFRQFSDGAIERVWVASEIKKLVEEGVEPSEIAILYRGNREAEEMSNELESKGLSVSVESSQNALGDPDVRRLLALLGAVAQFGNDEAMLAALHLPFIALPALDAYRIASYAKRQDMLLADILKSKKALKDARVEDIESAQKLYRLLVHFSRTEGSVPHALQELIEESGFLTFALKSKRATEILEKVGGLMRDAMILTAADPDYTLAKLAEHLALLEEHRIPVGKENRLQARKGAVRLMTAHKAKGMEFDYVFVINVADGVWGGKSERTTFELPVALARGTDEDERRLLYVALTRGRHAVFVSSSRVNDTGAERLRSRLLEDLPPQIFKEFPVTAFESAQERRIAPGRTARIKQPEVTYLRELFVEQGLSVTALNNFLKCPWEYFYNNLLRVPSAPNKDMAFGTAAHAALRRYFETRNRGKAPSKQRLIEWFVEATDRAPLSRAERTEMRKRGEVFLEGWHAAWNASFPKRTLSEYKVTLEMPIKDTSIKSIRLRGDLDRLDFVGDSDVRVVDYKTGKPKTRNAILGKTKDETGPGYYRQLTFYKLLLGLEGRYRFMEGELDFLQPDERKKYHKETFTISDDEVEALKEAIEKTASEIWNLSFWNSRCGRPECRFCELRDLMLS